MKYKYVKYELGQRSGYEIDFNLITEKDVTDGNVVQAIRTDTDKPTPPIILDTADKLELFSEGRRRALVWPGPGPVVRETPAPVKGDHYQGYLEDLQWIDAMSRIPRYRDPAVFKGAVELQVRKYLDRLGRKDDDLQELMKALWYLKYLCAYIKAGNKPIKGKDVDDILRS